MPSRREAIQILHSTDAYASLWHGLQILHSTDAYASLWHGHVVKGCLLAYKSKICKQVSQGVTNRRFVTWHVSKACNMCLHVLQVKTTYVTSFLDVTIIIIK